MDYKRKNPLDYKDIAENMRNPAWYDLENGTELLEDASAAIIDLLTRAETAEARAHELETTHRTEMCEDGFDCVELGKVRKELEAAKAKLAAYEELDLEPQEIERIVDAYGRGMSLRTECALRLQIIREIPTNLLHEMARDYTGKKNVNVPCKLGDPVYIIVNPGGRKTVRPTYVTRIEIDELMRPVIHTNCGFGLWGDRIFPDRTSAERKIAEKKGDQHGEQ